MQGCIFKVTGAIPYIANELLDLKTNKDQTVNDIIKSMTSLIHTCADSLTIMGCVNPTVEQNRRYHIAGCLDSRYRMLSKNVPSN